MFCYMDSASTANSFVWTRWNLVGAQSQWEMSKNTTRISSCLHFFFALVFVLCLSFLPTSPHRLAFHCVHVTVVACLPMSVSYRIYSSCTASSHLMRASMFSCLQRISHEHTTQFLLATAINAVVILMSLPFLCVHCNLIINFSKVAIAPLPKMPRNVWHITHGWSLGTFHVSWHIQLAIK